MSSSYAVVVTVPGKYPQFSGNNLNFNVNDVINIIVVDDITKISIPTGLNIVPVTNSLSQIHRNIMMNLNANPSSTVSNTTPIAPVSGIPPKVIIGSNSVN